jgi:hypothetical protein
MNVNTSTNRPVSRRENLDKLSEAKFLQQEKEDAQRAMSQSIESLKQSFKTAADLKLWADHHPWLTVGAAAAAGFAAGSTIVGAASKEEPAPDRSSSRERFAANDDRRQPSALWSSLMAPLFDLAKVAVQSSIASAMGGAMQAQAQDQANAERAAETADPFGRYAEPV